MTDADLLALIVSGDDIAFEVDGQPFAFRQPRPMDIDRMRHAQTLAADTLRAEYRRAGLADEPVSAEMEAARTAYLAALEIAYTAARDEGDSDTARNAAADMEIDWPETLVEERARAVTTRALGRWIVDNLLVGNRDDLLRLTRPDPLSHDAVIEAVQKVIRVTNYDPNLTRRTG